MGAPSTDGSTVAWRSNCPVSCALDVLGDRWSLLIVRDLLVHGTRTYSQFRTADERISTNILADRLKLLSELGLIEREHPDRPARENSWVLTEQASGLGPILLDLAAWSHAALSRVNADITDIGSGRREVAEPR